MKFITSEHIFDKEHDINLCTGDIDCQCPCSYCKKLSMIFSDGTPVEIYEKFEGITDEMGRIRSEV